MRGKKLDKLLRAISTLSRRERRTLLAKVAALQAGEASVRAIESAAADAYCPSCGSAHIVKDGVVRGLQRFLCRACGHTFNALSTTPLKGLHQRGKWLAHAAALVRGQSVRQVARELGIARTTAFRWRHRFLRLSSERQAARLVGIAEADESYFLESCKGQRGLLRRARHRGGSAAQRGLSHEQVAVLMVRDRAGATANVMVERTTAQQEAQALRPMLPRDTILCTDGSHALAAAAALLGVQHHGVNVSAGVRVDGPWHVQNVNAYVSCLRGWMVRFKGVATRYLASYLGWFRMLDGQRQSALPSAAVLVLAIKR